MTLLTQLSGINAIIYEGPKILEEAGLQIGETLGGQVIIGIVNVLITIIKTIREQSGIHYTFH